MYSPDKLQFTDDIDGFKQYLRCLGYSGNMVSGIKYDTRTQLYTVVSDYDVISGTITDLPKVRLYFYKDGTFDMKPAVQNDENADGTRRRKEEIYSSIGGGANES